jgi:hypothetical protein
MGQGQLNRNMLMNDIMQNQNNTLNQLNNLPSESPGYIIIQGDLMAERKKKLLLLHTAIQ